MHEKKNQRIIPHLLLIIFFMALILSLYSMWLFMNGFHNLDIGQNIIKLNAETGLNYVDRTMSGETMTGSELYSYGHSNQRQAFILFGISLFLMGVTLSKLIKVKQ